MREEIAYRGAKDVGPACEAIIARHQLRSAGGQWTRERGITIRYGSGGIIRQLASAGTLRRWYYLAEKARHDPAVFDGFEFGEGDAREKFDGAQFGVWCSQWEAQAEARYAEYLGAEASGRALQFHLRSGRAGAVDLIESINECNAVAVKAHKGAGVMPKPRRNRR